MDRTSAELSQADRLYEAGELDRAFKLYKDLAESGDLIACQNLAFLYKVGEGVAPCDDSSRFWYARYYCLLRRMARRGDLDACFRLGKALQYGDNIRLDEAEAITFLTIAAEGGLPDAEFHLACLYQHGWCGLERDFELSQLWLDRACRSEHPEALFTEGELRLSRGDSTGMALIRRASLSGFWPARNRLSELEG